MPDQGFLSLTGARGNALAGITKLANSKIHLFKAGFAPTVTTLVTDFEAQECDFDGYAEKTIVAWNADPVLAGDGYLIFAPTQVWVWAHVAADVGNQVGGFWIELAGGSLYGYGTFDPTRPAQGPDQAIVVTPQDIYRAG